MTVRPSAPRGVLAAVFAAALVLRLVMLQAVLDHGFSTKSAFREALVAESVLRGDGFTVDRNKQAAIDALLDRIEARRIEFTDAGFAGPSDVETAFSHPPGYVLLLAGTFRLFGDQKFLYSVVLQVVLDSLTAVLLYFLGARLFGSRAGLVASVAYALWVPSIALSTLTYPDACIPFLMVLGTLLFVRGWQTERQRDCALAGLVVGVAANFRPEMILYPIFLAAGGFLLQTRPLGGAMVSVALLFVVSGLGLAPWVARNYARTGTPFVTTSAGVSLWQGLGEYPNPWGIQFSDEASDRHAKALGFASAWDPAANEYFLREFRARVRENPGYYARKTVRNAISALNVLPPWCCQQAALLPGIYAPDASYAATKDGVGGRLSYALANPVVAGTKALVHAGRWAGNALIWLSVAYCFLRVRDAQLRGAMLLLVSIALFAILSHIPFSSTYRYYTPGHFAYLLFFALAASRLASGRPCRA